MIMVCIISRSPEARSKHMRYSVVRVANEVAVLPLMTEQLNLAECRKKVLLVLQMTREEGMISHTASVYFLLFCIYCLYYVNFVIARRALLLLLSEQKYLS